MPLETKLPVDEERALLKAYNSTLIHKLEATTLQLEEANLTRRRDTVEREAIEVAMQESRDRLGLATLSARMGIWDWDVTANRLQWDTRMYELYGIRAQDFSGAYDAWQAGLHPEDLRRGDAAIAAALDGKQDFHIEFRVVWPNGSALHRGACAGAARGRRSPLLLQSHQSMADHEQLRQRGHHPLPSTKDADTKPVKKTYLTDRIGSLPIPWVQATRPPERTR